MEILLYTNKQIFGGFAIIFLICILFVVNLTLTYGNVQYFTNINLSYFTTPIIFTLCLVAILYVVALNKSIKTTLDKYIKPDEFNMDECPDGYTTSDTGECEPDCPDGYNIVDLGNNNYECDSGVSSGVGSS